MSTLNIKKNPLEVAIMKLLSRPECGFLCKWNEARIAKKIAKQTQKRKQEQISAIVKSYARGFDHFNYGETYFELAESGGSSYRVRGNLTYIHRNR